jgi:hypothetical protein
MAKWGTKNPPVKKGLYLVTLTTSIGGNQVRLADRTEYPKGNWYWYIFPDGQTTKTDVIAWQKCPKPYEDRLKEGKEE